MVRGIEDVVQQSGLAGALEGIKENAKGSECKKRGRGKKKREQKKEEAPLP